MNTSRIKNFIIILLAVVNLFFLCVVVSDSVRERAARREVLEEVREILASNGISVLDSVDTRRRALPVCYVSRDVPREEELVTGVLGETSGQSEGGGIVFYSGENGQAQFRGTGDFDFAMLNGAIRSEKDAEQTARAFAEKLGLSVDFVSASFERDGTGTVDLMCRAQGSKVLNCRVICDFYGGSLILIRGTRPLDAAYADKTGEEPMDVPTVLMRFLELVNEGGYVCSELKELELCYVQRASASGRGTLNPVWRLVTDSGEFCLDGLTGEYIALT